MPPALSSPVKAWPGGFLVRPGCVTCRPKSPGPLDSGHTLCGLTPPHFLQSLLLCPFLPPGPQHMLKSLLFFFFVSLNRLGSPRAPCPGACVNR